MELNELTDKFLYEQHVINHLSPEKIKTKFNINLSIFKITSLLKKQNIYKTTHIDFSALETKVPKEKFISFYSVNSKKATLSYFSISDWEFKHLIQKYGYKKSKENSNQLRQQTCLQKYGVNNYTQTQEYINKVQTTKLNKYGNANFVNSAKRVKTFLNHTDEEKKACQEKKTQTFLERYGTSYFNNREKAKTTRIANAGSTQASYIEQLKKAKSTNQARYGTPYISKNPEIKEKISTSWHNKSNEEMEAILLKRQQTCLNKYGVTNYNKLIKCTEQRKQTFRNNYGLDWATQRKIETYSPVYKQIYQDKNKSIVFLQNNTDLTIYELAKKLNCPVSSVVFWINRFKLNSYVKNEKSHYEDDIINYIGKDICLKDCRSILDDNKEIDIYVPKYKLGIEFNGNYWHSDLNKPKNYHFNKSKEAENKGIHLVHIYEYEWNNPIKQTIIKSILDLLLQRKQNIIYARQCKIKQISNLEAKPFNNQNHLQGHRNAQVTYGLFYKDKLVQLMSFSSNKKYGWEIIRGCPGSNNVVVGGVSKLFSHFVKDYNPSSIFSYCDFNKFNGVGYEKLGMKFIGYTGPDKKYIIDEKVVNRNPKKWKQYSEQAEGIIWGAGSKKYLWTNQTKLVEGSETSL
jgi:hypothetical protein